MSGIRRQCLSSRRSLSLYLFMRRVLKQIVVIIEHITFVNYIQNFIQHPAIRVNSICRGSHQWRFRRNKSTIDRIFCIRHIFEKRWEYNLAVYQLFIDFKKSYDSDTNVALFNILIEFGVPMKLLTLRKVCRNEAYSRVR